MSDDVLYTLAEKAGLSLRWTDYRGNERAVSTDVLRDVLATMQLPAATATDARESLERLELAAQIDMPSMLVTRCDQTTRLPAAVLKKIKSSALVRLINEDESQRDVNLEFDYSGQVVLPPLHTPGYHSLLVGDEKIALAVAPHRAYSIQDSTRDASEKSRLWGLSAQLYSLRRKQNDRAAASVSGSSHPDALRINDGGFGDFTALANLARAAAVRGADALAMSPVHALYGADVSHFSPYSPSSRLFLNALHIDVASIVTEERLRECVISLGLSNELARLQQLELIDWPAAARAKLSLLRKVWSQLGSRWAQSDHKLALSFRVFRQHGGTALEDHARFEAIHTQQFSHDPKLWNWRNWSAPMRDPTSAAVAEFAQQHADEISFHIFLQWLASRGLDAAQTAAREAGMAIGLIADLAVGTDGGGSHVWSRQREFLVGVAVGAPPDAMNTHGQDWGLTTFSPVALQQHAYAPFLEMLRATLRHAGGLRIDHILGLRRLWVLPSGGKATDGVYLSYPQQDLLNLIALESLRHRAVIVGEDLGTVPPGFSQSLTDAGVLGMQVLWFQRDHGFFIEPSRWSSAAMATTTTHDVPPIASWWRGHDIDWLAQIGILPEGTSAESQAEERNHDRQALWSALNYASVCTGEIPAVDDPQVVVDAAIAFVAKTPAPLAIIPLEDLFGLDQQLNIPGTTNQHPNWRRRLSAPAEILLDEPAVKNRLQILNRERGG